MAVTVLFHAKRFISPDNASTGYPQLTGQLPGRGKVIAIIQPTFDDLPADLLLNLEVKRESRRAMAEMNVNHTNPCGPIIYLDWTFKQQWNRTNIAEI